jgi:hypothetical protein
LQEGPANRESRAGIAWNRRLSIHSALGREDK